ncbi:PREDICTED: putative uncharacterized protein DDB_G0294196 [Ipomoea nil]|uniref:putative uncharacterized protein DDB_G0294196 n=1 Tax=Ipomoea nil TaxID=35883 RepID=UPI000900A602|nr:PREDICTED: putative uncharacterized protein DDB_G0294196 [Ipomoea nil]
MNPSQFTDKQIMDLSSSPITANNKIDFLDLVNPRQDVNGSGAKEEIVPSYEFHPIRPIGSSSPPMSNADSSNVGGARAWNSADSKTNTGIRNYGSLESMEPAKVIVEKDGSRFDSTLVSEIDHTMKKYTDNLLHVLDGVSARISQLETRTRQIENSVDDLKLSVGNNFGGTDGKLRQLENIMREVHTEVQVIRDKQEIVEAKLEVAKLQVSKVEQKVDTRNTLPMDSLQPAASAPQHSPQQQYFPANLQQPLPTLPPLDAPPHPPQQNLPPQAQLPNQLSLNQISSGPPRESYIPAPEIPSQQYQMPLQQQLQISPPPLPQQQYQSPPQPQYSQPPLPPQSHLSLPPVNPSQPPQPQHQPPLGHHTEEPTFIPQQSFPPNIVKPPSLPSSGALPQQFYGAAPNMYELPSNRPGPGFSGTYGPSSGHGEPYFSQYGSGSPRKSQQLPPTMSQSGGSGYPQLPTARILPQALPTASAVGGSSSSVGSGNRVPVDDVVEKVTHMGFPRDQVKETVRKLTDNGQAVDLNVVLDKLMNDGDVQPPRGWFGR